VKALVEISEKKGDIMQEIDIRLLFDVLLRRMKWIVAITVVAAVLLGAYTHFLVADTYSSSFSMYVRNVSIVEENQAVSNSGLVVSQALV
jgi:capsular polysaccharide biosynthesis protein